MTRRLYLRTGSQRDLTYLVLAPQGLVPASDGPDGLLGV